MTKVLITIDTELSLRLFQRGATANENFSRSIDCDGFGICWQMDKLDAHGLTGVFFVDPMAALVYGIDVIARIVTGITASGHEVQLHVHSEWLAWATQQPVGDRRGRSIGDFELRDQETLVRLAQSMLIEAGAPPPVAFRAGNYGANDDTLRAIAKAGLLWDSSFSPTYLGDPCEIGLPASHVDPVERLGITEIAVSAIEDRSGHLRHAQLCALSAQEMTAALGHAAATGRPVFTIVTHSFEMMSRDRKRPNRLFMKRFETMCHAIDRHAGLSNSGFSGLDLPASKTPPSRLAPDYLRTVKRFAEQAFAAVMYER